MRIHHTARLAEAEAEAVREHLIPATTVPGINGAAIRDALTPLADAAELNVADLENAADALQQLADALQAFVADHPDRITATPDDPDTGIPYNPHWLAEYRHRSALADDARAMLLFAARRCQRNKHTDRGPASLPLFPNGITYRPR